MSSYTQAQLSSRNAIIQSQKLFWDFIDADIINKLINLFDKNNKYSKETISKYIEDERNIQGLQRSGVDIESSVYGYNNKNSTLFLIIKKNNRDFLHLSFHLSPNSMDPKHAGLIHMYTNVYNKGVSRSIQKKLYALILVQRPPNKLHSLEFSIPEWHTPSEVHNAHLYDSEIQKAKESFR